MTNSTHSRMRRGLCLLLAFVMLVGCTGLTAFADDDILLEEETEAAPDERAAITAAEETDDGLLTEEPLPIRETADEIIAGETAEADSGAVPAGDDTGRFAAPDDTGWADLQKAINEAESGDTITLTQDVLAHADDRRLRIENKDITIDLAGFNIDRGLTEETAEWVSDTVIMVMEYAGLTLINSAPGTSSAITGGYLLNGSGGGILNRGTLTIQAADGGGEIAIVNNYAYNGGGIYNDYDSTMMILGGRIENNTVSNLGGGICNRGTLTVDGTVITHCTAAWYGGGIYNGKELNYRGGEISFCSALYGNGGAVANPAGSTMAMFGGTFRYNNAPSGGAISNGGSLTLSKRPVIQYNNAAQAGGGIDFKGELKIAGGNPVITKNTVLAKPNNIFIHTDKLIDLTGYIGADALIGVTLEENEGQVTRGTYTNGNSANINLSYLGFVGDEYNCTVLRTSAGEKEVGLHIKKSDYISSKPFLEQSELELPVPPRKGQRHQLDVRHPR